MSVLKALILGIIQGATEFLPVSSTGHLAVLNNLFGIGVEGEINYFFISLLHLGSLLAVMIYYNQDIRAIKTDAVNFLLKHGDEGIEPDGRMKPGLRMLFIILVASLPLIAAIPLYGIVSFVCETSWIIAILFFVSGGIIYLSNGIKVRRKNELNCKFLDALIIGIAQLFSVFPGLSRAAVTISSARFRGCSKEFAARLYFLLSIPALLGMFILNFTKAVKIGIEWKYIPMYLVGIVAAAVVGYAAIYFINRLISKGNFGKISFYCFGVGLVTLILSFVL